MDDVQLLQRYAAGKEDAFQELVNQYKDGVYTFLRRFLNDRDLVDDVFQETFLQLYVSRDTFDRSKPLRPWLFTIAANKAKDALRRRQHGDFTTLGSMFDNEERSIEDVLSLLHHDDHLPCDDLIRDETAAAVQQVIARLPERLREILILAYYQKFSYEEIRGILGIPVGTVKSRLHTAVRRFAEDWKAVMMYETADA